MTKYVWLSYTINSVTPAFGGGWGFQCEQTQSLTKGDSCNHLLWHFPNHLGTHVDTPGHFYENGVTVDEFEPEFWFFTKIIVIEVDITPNKVIIEPEDVIPFMNGSPDIVIIKTGVGSIRGKQQYWENNPGLSPELGERLRKQYPGLKAVGTDSISISNWHNRELGRKAHRYFLNPVYGEKFVLVEDMKLSTIDSKTHIDNIIISPLRIEAADGSPCTIVAKIDLNK